VHQFNDTAVAYVAYILFKGDTQYQDLGPIDGFPGFNEQLDRLLAYVNPHGIVDPSSGQDNFRMVADLLGLVCQIVGIYGDAMPPHQARLERQKVPLGPGCLADLMGIYPQALEQHGKLVHQGDYFLLKYASGQ